jgi:hypothetical protein
MKTANSVRGKCGANSDDTRQGFCPACLLENGLALFADESVAGVVDLGCDDGVQAAIEGKSRDRQECWENLAITNCWRKSVVAVMV